MQAHVNEIISLDAVIVNHVSYSQLESITERMYFVLLRSSNAKNEQKRKQMWNFKLHFFPAVLSSED